MRLKPLAVKALLQKPGKHGLGDNLWLTVTKPGQGLWSSRHTLQGKQIEMGHGSAALVSYGEACARADAARRLVLDGVNPVAARRAERVAATAQRLTVRAAAEAYIEAHRPGWRNAKHAAQWRASLEAHAYPAIGDAPVGAVDTDAVLAVLRPIWTAKPETASRVRGRIELVLDYSKARGWRDGENPARWRGHLALMLPRPSRVRAVRHHAALPWPELPAFMRALGRREGVAASALGFAILTAARSGEVRLATWREVDWERALWVVPGARMKAGKEHRVPLSEAALALLRQVEPLGAGPDSLVFPGRDAGRPLSDMTLTAVLRRMGRGDVTCHGFRSAFRDWCAETGEPADLAEAALAHAVGDKVVAAYQRGDLLERRRGLMARWADFAAPAPTLGQRATDRLALPATKEG